MNDTRSQLFPSIAQVDDAFLPSQPPITMSQNPKAGLGTTIADEENNDGADVPVLSDRFADESYKLFQKLQVTDPTPEQARHIRNKCLWRILPFLCVGYHLMYVDKQTVCSNFFSIFLCYMYIGD